MIRGTVAIVAFLFAAPTLAGQLGLKCNGLAPQATLVRYYVEGQEAPIGVSAPGESIVIDEAPDGCVYRDYTCTQVVSVNGNEAESPKSPATRSIARPRVFSVESTDVGLVQVNGENFALDSYVWIDGQKIQETTRISCQTLRVPDQAFLTLIVKDDVGGLQVEYTLPIPAPDAVSVN